MSCTILPSVHPDLHGLVLIRIMAVKVELMGAVIIVARRGCLYTDVVVIGALGLDALDGVLSSMSKNHNRSIALGAPCM